ncbi:PREDICTED: F-box protein At5g07610-like [Fragaria vesca subsp. vesca]|uniref:F-box protein At5g07610-like n=1 Tax=Fragaria vesca subsp. vesca TaxID=101020 RepID=UPI0002C2F596|nr:PREDICTED: F-box protein At5g07610-like [Fragaria vesca subsp. vesca]
MSKCSEAAEAVANIEELLTQILESVPLQSLTRFKCVSKHWQSLISNLRTLKYPKITSFVSSKTEAGSFKSIPIDHREIPSGWNPFKTFNDSFTDGSWLKIIQSCNGLFLCCVSPSIVRREKDLIVRRPNRGVTGVFVVNPATKRFLALSSPTSSSFNSWERYALAFEPSKSPHYTLVCVTTLNGTLHQKIHIYSSKTQEWKHVADLLSSELRYFRSDERSREGSVYSNGAVHWIRDINRAGFPKNRLFFCKKAGNFSRLKSDVLHYFDIGEENFLVVAATPPVPTVVKNIPLKECRNRGLKTPIVWPILVHRYFGDCGGRLYLIEVYSHCNTQFDVMEMGKDYSGWFIKYHVDLNPTALPQCNLDPFVILCLSREREEEFGDPSTTMMLHMPGKVISYNLRDKNFKTSSVLTIEDTKMYKVGYYPYMETLACV